MALHQPINILIARDCSAIFSPIYALELGRCTSIRTYALSIGYFGDDRDSFFIVSGDDQEKDVSGFKGFTFFFQRGFIAEATLQLNFL